jgi:hypothetical protein
MNILPLANRAQVISALVEGTSINATVRMTGVARHMILKLPEDRGCLCLCRIPSSASARPSRHTVALHFMHYNFCRVHKTLRATPAMGAGLTNQLLTIEEVVSLIQ